MQLINKTGRLTPWFNMIYFSACLLVSIIVIFDAWEPVLNLLAHGLR